MVEDIERPYSYLFPYERFPYRAYKDRNGKTVVELVKKPLLDSIPISFDAVESGRRAFGWREDVPAAVTFAEAQDGGDPTREVAVRDHVYQLEAPFSSPPRLLCGTTNRFTGVSGAKPEIVPEDNRIAATGKPNRNRDTFHLAEAQAFVDGNKRTGIGAALVFLEGNGIPVPAAT